MRINRSLLNWGVFLIALGGVPLAVKQGWADSGIAGDLWRVWPLILVGIGLGLILRWTPAAWLGGAHRGGHVRAHLRGAHRRRVQASAVPAWASTRESRERPRESGPASGSSFTLQLELSCGELDVTRGTADEWSVIASTDPRTSPRIEGSRRRAWPHAGRQARTSFFAFTQQRRSDWQRRVFRPAPALSVGMTLNAATRARSTSAAAPSPSSARTFNASDVTLDLGERYDDPAGEPRAHLQRLVGTA